MVTQYNMDKFLQGKNGFGLPFCTTVYSVTLSADTDTTVSVPSTAAMGAPAATAKNKFMAIITYNNTSPVYACINATAAKPTGNTFAAVTSEIVPSNSPWGRVVKSGDVIHVISAGTPTVSVAFYAIQE